jgi:hypothetical protein
MVAVAGASTLPAARPNGRCRRGSATDLPLGRGLLDTPRAFDARLRAMPEARR